MEPRPWNIGIFRVPVYIQRWVERVDLQGSAIETKSAAWSLANLGVKLLLGRAWAATAIHASRATSAPMPEHTAVIVWVVKPPAGNIQRDATDLAEQDW